MFENWGTFMCHVIVYAGCTVCLLGAILVVCVLGVAVGFGLCEAVKRLRQRTELTLLTGWILCLRVIRREKVRYPQRDRILAAIVRKMDRTERRNLIADIERLNTSHPEGTIGRWNTQLNCQVHALQGALEQAENLIEALKPFTANPEIAAIVEYHREWIERKRKDWEADHA